MPDKKLTDKEIVKALECCANCESCDYETTDCPLGKEMECRSLLAKSALDLIYRLQARVEKCEKVEHFADKTIATLQAEKEKLKEEVGKEFTCFVGDPHKVEHCPYLEQLETTRAEAYKEFAELLHCQCESIINQPHNENVRPISWKVAYEEFDEKVDNLLKEMVGEGDTSLNNKNKI